MTRAAVIGTGFIGTVHVEAIRRMGVEVSGVLSGSPESTERGRAKLNLARGYHDLEEILEDSAVDVVHVTSPNSLHYEQVRAILDANKHVICEKPLALTSNEGAELMALADSKSLVHGLCFNTRFYPMVHQAQSYLDEGNLGEVRYILGSYHQDWLMQDTDWNWRLESEKAGELRAIADIGSHLIDQIQFVTGLEVSEVFADLHTLIKVRKKPSGPVETFTLDNSSEREDVLMNSDDAGGILLRFSNGARGTLSISQVAGGRKNTISWEIAGAKSSLGFNSESPESLWIGHRSKPNELALKDPSTLSKSAARNAFYPGGHIEGFGETFRALFERIYRDIKTLAWYRDYPTFADGVRSLKITDAISLSNRSQSWIKVI